MVWVPDRGSIFQLWADQCVIGRKIRRKNATHAKVKKSGNAKFRAKFETLKREIKADIRK